VDCRRFIDFRLLTKLYDYYEKKLIFASMNSIKIFLLSMLLFIPGIGNSQSSYQVGTAQVSIEPDKSLVSLHLGGYGAPREGRFTLHWKELEQLSEVTSMTGLDGKIFIVSNNDLLWKNIDAQNSSWKTAGRAANIKAIAGLNGKLYAVNNNGELLETKVSGSIKWRKIGSVDKTVKTLTASGNMIFAADENKSLLSADISKKRMEWLKIEAINGIISLAADDRKLYLLTNEGVIYQCEHGKKDYNWLKAAYKNGATIKEDIRHITITENGIYGVSSENLLYEGEHRSEGNLTSRAMAIRKGNNTVVIVNVDVCGLNDTFTGLLKREIYNKNNLASSAIFINSSHTHFAPVSQDWLTWQEPNQRPDTIYLYQTVRNGILTAVDNAIKALAPAELFFGRGTVDIGYNRSLKDHQELYDSAVDVIKVEYMGKKHYNYLFLTACHPVFSTAGTLHYTLSANYPGVARRLVEERTGTSTSLFLQGAAGDINPKDNGEYISGEKLANEVIAVLNRPMTKIEGEISFFLDTINIPVTPWTNDEILAYRKQNSNKTGNVDAEKNVKWCDLMLRYYKEGTMASVLPVYINTFNIGNWKLVGFSRETTTGYSFGVKNLWPDKLISVAGYTNDVSSYLPTHMHIEKRGYEGLNSFFWYGMPNVFPMTVDETVLNTIKTLER
jgi:hypothetical protein